MLTNKQKKSFKLIAIFSILLSIIALVPFRSFGNSSTIHSIEMGVKFLFIPLMLVLMSIRANIIKYRELKVNRYRSKVVNVMSYFPLTVYLVSLLIFTIHTMTISGDGVKSTTPLGLGLWNALFVAIIIYVCYLIIQIIFVNKIILNFSEEKLQIFDISFIVISVFLIFISGSIVTAYFENFKSYDFYQKGNVLLLIIFIAGYLAAYFTGRRMKQFINEDEQLLVTNMGEIISGNPTELTKKVEYRHALNDILNEFSEYFDNGGKKATNESDTEVDSINTNEEVLNDEDKKDDDKEIIQDENEVLNDDNEIIEEVVSVEDDVTNNDEEEIEKKEN